MSKVPEVLRGLRGLETYIPNHHGNENKCWRTRCGTFSQTFTSPQCWGSWPTIGHMCQRYLVMRSFFEV